MTTYIALLRGINVSDQKKIKMAELKVQLEELGLENVRTYIQTGNIVFDSVLDAHSLEEKIQQKILSHYQFHVEVLVLKPEVLKEAVEGYPFVEAEDKLRYFTFLSEAPKEENIKRLEEKDYSPELYQLQGKVVYIYPVNGYGKTKFSNNYIESKLKVKATTRNLNTVCKLIELSC